MGWREAHRRRVAELENDATAMLLGAMAPILSGVAARFAVVATTAAAGDAEARASLDDLAAIQTQWGYAVDQTVLPWFGGMFEAGAEAAEEQVQAIRGVGVVIPTADPELLNHAAAQYLADTRNRFYPLGEAAWTAAREELVVGFRAGEGIDALRRRITDVVDLTAREAELLARTEVISASNMGAQARVDLMGADAPPYRQWLSTMDNRTRPTHVAADGQVVAADEQFTVGSARLRVPGDPTGPGAEVINCRCTVLFIDTPEALVAEGRQQGGVVDEVARMVAAAGPDQVDSTTGEPHTGSMVALIPADGERLLVADGEPLDALHLTLAYLGDGADIPEPVFDSLVAQIETWAADEPPVVGNVFGVAAWNTMGDTPSLVLSVGGPRLAPIHDWVTTMVGRASVAGGPGALWTMPDQHAPWVAHVCVGYGDVWDPMAVAVADEGPITFDRIRVTRGADAQDFELAGATPEEDDVPMNRAELTAAVEDAVAAAVARGGAAIEPIVINLNLTAAIDDDDPDAPSGRPVDDPEGNGPPAQAGEHLRAVMHQQGTATGLGNTGRVFTNLTYRDTPFAYHVQVHSSAHGGTPKVVPVGVVTRVVEDGDTHYGFIRLDLDSPDGWEHGRRAVAGFDRWVSIGADETAATTTLVWPAPGEMDDDPVLEEVDPNEPIEEVVIQPERVIIDGANVAELTGVSTPAQADAVLEPTDELVALMGPAPAEMVDEPMEPALAAAALATGGHVAPPDAGCGCGGSCTTCGQDRAIDDLMAGAQESHTAAALTAAAHTITLPDLPPAAWFQEPVDVDLDGAFCVTDDGRIYGLLAPYGTGHRAWAASGGRREAPRGNVDYTRFMGKWALTAEGRVHAGPVTMDCGHAPIHRADHHVAVEHYDNACSVIGAVAVGESDRLGGVWMAGAVLPGTKPDQIARALACSCSGDWQPHPDVADTAELVACLLVPVPGFARAHPTTSYRGDTLVASTVPVVHVPTAEIEASRRRAAGIATVARLSGRTPAARVLTAIKGTR